MITKKDEWKFVFVDYKDLVKKDEIDDWEDISELAKKLSKIAKVTGIPVLVSKYRRPGGRPSDELTWNPEFFSVLKRLNEHMDVVTYLKIPLERGDTNGQDKAMEQEVKIGQVWQHREYDDVRIRITGIVKDHQIVHRTFKGPVHTAHDFVVIESRYKDKDDRKTVEHSWQLGKENKAYGSIKKIWKLVNWPELIIQNDDEMVVKRKSGANCEGCKKHYPYAERTAGFKCWSCKNGY